MIHRYGPCIGLTLFRWRRFKVELWTCPKDFSPPPHAHDLSDGEFLVLYGKGRNIWRSVNGRRDEYDLTGKFRWRWFSVRSGTPHGFSTGKTCMIWVCCEHWKTDNVTSVATDFQLI